MNRRDFLSRFAQTAAGALALHTLDVDKLLWVAGERTIFLPTPLYDYKFLHGEITFKGIPLVLDVPRVYFLSPYAIYYSEGVKTDIFALTPATDTHAPIAGTWASVERRLEPIRIAR